MRRLFSENPGRKKKKNWRKKEEEEKEKPNEITWDRSCLRRRRSCRLFPLTAVTSPNPTFSETGAAEAAQLSASWPIHFIIHNRILPEPFDVALTGPRRRHVFQFSFFLIPSFTSPFPFSWNIAAHSPR